jgi:Ankyrin repeat/Ankyrin repeats (3 copies)
MPPPHHELIEDAEFRYAVEFVDTGDANGLREYLRAHPNLVHQRVHFEGNYFTDPTLLEFVAENPVRRGRLPANIVDVAKVILEAGAKTDSAALNETLALVSSGRIARECGVQRPLINCLSDYGADPDYAMDIALTHGEFGAVNALLERGARFSLQVAAGLGRIDEARQLLGAANAEDRHGALALAAQFGHAEIVRLLLDAGEDPSRFNPPGFHAHSTPLHQAALAGHDQVVRLLVERGAKLDIRDKVWQATPAGWAQYEGRTAIAEYLVSAGK